LAEGAARRSVASFTVIATSLKSMPNKNDPKTD